MKRISAPMTRVNTRITPEQHKFIKDQAKKTKRTEGEVFRLALDTYINRIFDLKK
jgi:predicted DNA-binding protein